MTKEQALEVFNPDNMSKPLPIQRQAYAVLKESVNGIDPSKLKELELSWRSQAELAKWACRRAEDSGSKTKSDRHYQRSLDLHEYADIISNILKQ